MRILSRNNNMKNLLKKYQNGEIEKHQFVDEMYKIHEVLEQYQELLDERDISSIQIRKTQIIFTFDDGEEIKLVHNRNDKYGIPLQYLNFNGYEKDVFSVMTDLVHNGDTVFDIGANIGWYGLKLNKHFKNVNVYSFEPLPTNYSKLLENFKLNGLSTDKAFDLGFFNENTHLEFFHDLENSKASSLTNLRGTHAVEKVICHVVRLDDFVKNQKIGRLDFIKCDVEGAELFVFQGAIDTLQLFRPIVLTEMLRKWAAKFDYHPNDIISLFHSIGYQCFELLDGHLQKILEVTDQTISTNFVFLSEDQLKNHDY